MGSKKIVVLGTGGTIAGRSGVAGDNVGYTAGQVAVADLLGGLAIGSHHTLLAEQVAQVDSKDMGFALWHTLVNRIHHWVNHEKVDAVVVTHGTDTLEETAYFLHAVLQTPVPVVLTCAMRPASSPHPDGPQNLQDAIALATTVGVTGVNVVCAGTVHSAADVQKIYPYRVDAFSSGDAGAMGYIEEGRLRQCRAWIPPMAHRAGRLLVGTQRPIWPYVEWVASYAGCNGAAVDALLALPAALRPRGLVVAATGNGTLHTSLEAALDRAIAMDVQVVRATRCTFGPMVEGGASRFDSLVGLSPVKARIALMLNLMG